MGSAMQIVNASMWLVCKFSNGRDKDVYQSNLYASPVYRIWFENQCSSFTGVAWGELITFLLQGTASAPKIIHYGDHEAVEDHPQSLDVNTRSNDLPKYQNSRTKNSDLSSSPKSSYVFTQRYQENLANFFGPIGFTLLGGIGAFLNTDSIMQKR